ncbi:MAG: DUF3307 domain-containing protein [Flavobacteriaceae bacterium]|nr:MAG: DUF3307 domain-containing protein [Flavobacteriaceae bacterium]
MVLFLKLLLAHFLGDFVFQPKQWIKGKEEKKIRSFGLYKHIAVHALLLLLFLESNFKNYWLGFAVIIISHFFIDALKISIQTEKTKRSLFFIDQLLHIIVLAGIASYYGNFEISLAKIISFSNLLYIVFIVFATFVSAVFIKTIISRWHPYTEDKEDDSLSEAGKYIGMLERLLVFIFIVINQWAAIGFLMAAKSIFRFGDLTSSKDRKLTEYILIGTLLSFGMAIITGLLFLYIDLKWKI